MASRKAKRLYRLFVFALLAGAAAGLWLYFALLPMPAGIPLYVRFEKTTEIREVLDGLAEKGVVRSPFAIQIYAVLLRRPKEVYAGTYEVRPGMRVGQVFEALKTPVRRMFRFPETNWARRSANLLEKQGICPAAEYLVLAASPQEFQQEVALPLPKAGTLEGYLYPDTYDLPPLLGARGVVLRQLEAFEEKVWDKFGHPKNLKRVLTIASLVELEVMRDDERPIVAGVIENRLKKGMRLQIDATVCYALGKWKDLTRKEIAETDSPYNTYRVPGLPPGPICSPSQKSIEAALHPASHPHLYYVALPDGRHLFSSTYEEHLRNVGKRKEALALRQR